MKYKCVLLKDYPGYPKGTLFYWNNRDDHNYIGAPSIDGKSRGCFYPHPLEKVVVLPESEQWFTKEPDPDSLTALSCPVCQNDKAMVNIADAKSSWDDGVRYFRKQVITECSQCGHKRELITFISHSRLED